MKHLFYFLLYVVMKTQEEEREGGVGEGGRRMQNSYLPTLFKFKRIRIHKSRKDYIFLHWKLSGGIGLGSGKPNLTPEIWLHKGFKFIFLNRKALWLKQINFICNVLKQ